MGASNPDDGSYNLNQTARETTVAPDMSYGRPVYASQTDPPEVEKAILKLHAMQSMHAARQRRILIGVVARELYAAGHEAGYGRGLANALDMSNKAPLKAAPERIESAEVAEAETISWTNHQDPTDWSVPKDTGSTKLDPLEEIIGKPCDTE